MNRTGRSLYVLSNKVAIYDQMDFIEEKKTRPNFKYTTYKGWLFGKAWKCYNESTGTVTMPERLNTVG